MKKIILFVLMSVCLLFTGCSISGGMRLIVYSNGTIVESFYVPFPKSQIVRQTGENTLAEQKVSMLFSNVKNVCNEQIFGPLLTTYQQKVNSSTEYSQEQKNALISGVNITNNLPSETVIIIGEITYIEYQITYANTDCYNIFKDLTKVLQEEKEIVEEVSFLTTTRRVTKDPLFDKVIDSATTIGKKMLSLVNEQMVEVYGESTWNQLKQILNYDEYSSYFSFTYVVPTARIHSNANSVKEINGYYYHIWNIPVENVDENGNSIAKIEYWQIIANKWVWYVLAIVGGLIVAGTTFVCYNIKQKREKINKEKQEDTFVIKE